MWDMDKRFEASINLTELGIIETNMKNETFMPNSNYVERKKVTRLIYIIIS